MRTQASAAPKPALRATGFARSLMALAFLLLPLSRSRKPWNCRGYGLDQEVKDPVQPKARSR